MPTPLELARKINSMSDSEWKNLSDVEKARLKAGLEHTLSAPERGVLERAATNFLPSLGNAFKDFGNAVSSPLETAKQGINLFAGQQKLLAGQHTDPQAIMAGQALGKSIPTAENFANDPVGVTANAAGLVSPLLRSVGGASTAARIARGAGAVGDILADPVVSAGKGVAGVARGGAKILGAGGKIALGASTGAKAGVIEAAFDENRKGNGAAFDDFISERRKGDELVDETISSAQNEVSKVNFKDRFNELRPESYSFDIRDIKQQAADLLADEFRIERGEGGALDLGGPSTINRSERSRFAGAAQELLDAPDEVTGLKLDTIKRSLGDTRLESTAGGVALGRLEGLVDARLKESIPGYRELMDDFRSAKDFQGRFEDATGVNVDNPGKRASVESRLDNALNENKDVTASALTEFEERTGQPLKAQIAGKALSKTDPGGLIGRGGFATLLTGLGVAGAATLDPSLLVTLVALPAFVPRVVGRSVGAAGKAAGKVDLIADQVRERIAPLARERGFNLKGLTIAQALERLTKEEDEQPQTFLGRLGAAGAR